MVYLVYKPEWHGPIRVRRLLASTDSLEEALERALKEPVPELIDIEEAPERRALGYR